MTSESGFGGKLDAIYNAAFRLRTAIRNAGPVPNHHWMVMERHRKEWPTLWEALDELLKAVEQ